MFTSSKWIVTLIIAGLSQTAAALPPDQMAIYYPIVHFVQDASRPNGHFDLEKANGWKRFVWAEMQPIIDTRVKTLLLRNPGGHDLTGGQLRFRQCAAAKQHGLDLISDLRGAMKLLVDGASCRGTTYILFRA